MTLLVLTGLLLAAFTAGAALRGGRGPRVLAVLAVLWLAASVAAAVALAGGGR